MALEYFMARRNIRTTAKPKKAGDPARAIQVKRGEIFAVEAGEISHVGAKLLGPSSKDAFEKQQAERAKNPTRRRAGRKGLAMRTASDPEIVKVSPSN